MDEDLITRLRANNGLRSVVGRTATGSPSVFWGERERKSTLAAIVMQLASPDRICSHGGVVGLQRERLQADCYGATHLDAKRALRGLIAAIEPEETVGATRFVRAFLVMNIGPTTETFLDGPVVKRIIAHFDLWHQPAA